MTTPEWISSALIVKTCAPMGHSRGRSQGPRGDRIGAFGIHQYIQEVTAQLSREGYMAVAQVLYHRLDCTRLFRHASEDAGARIKTMGSLGDASVTSAGI